MAMSNAEKQRRHRAKHGRTPARAKEIEALRAEGKNHRGWLFDDGVVDLLAVEMVVSGIRVPALTRYEAILVAKKVLDEAKSKATNNNAVGHVNATELLQTRLQCSRGTAEALMTSVRDKRPGKGLVR